jgi:hypothetical protein
MKQVLQPHGTIDDLIAEIQRYLKTVALFRALGCEPSWRAR